MYSKHPLSLRFSNQKFGKIYILPHLQHATFYTPLILLDIITQIKYEVYINISQTSCYAISAFLCYHLKGPNIFLNTLGLQPSLI